MGIPPNHPFCLGCSFINHPATEISPMALEILNNCSKYPIVPAATAWASL